MKIVRSDKTSIKSRTDLSRLSKGAAQKFLTTRAVRTFLEGADKLDFKTSKVLITADKSMNYVEKFANSKVRVRRVDHIVALLCLYSEDSFGTHVLSPEFHLSLKGLQEVIDKTIESGYSGTGLSVKVMDYIADNDFLYNNSPAPVFLLYNFFLYQDGYALVLEDTDQLDASLVLSIRYKVQNFAKKL